MSLTLLVKSPKVSMHLIKALIPEAKFEFNEKWNTWVFFLGEHDGCALKMAETVTGNYFEDEYNYIGVLDINFKQENDALLKAIESAGFRLANYDDIMLEDILGNKQD